MWYLLEDEINKGFLQKTCWYSCAQSGKCWWSDNCRSQKILSGGCESGNNHRYAVVVQDLTTHWTQSYPRKTITSQEIHKNLIKFLESTRNSNVIYTDNSLELRHWQLCRPVERPDSTHKHFACGCVDASFSHSHCPLAPADVAAFLTCMATIVQRVRGLGCWEPGVPAWASCRTGMQGGRWARGGWQICSRSGRIEVIVDGAQLAVDTTLVSPLHGDGSARRNSQAREGGPGWLVVLAAEVGGRWSEETALFLRALAKARAQESSQLLQGPVTAAYVRRWSALLACSMAWSLTLSLLEQRPVPSVGEDVPSVHEVLREARFVWALVVRVLVDGDSLFLLFVMIDVLSSVCRKKKKQEEAKRRIKEGTSAAIRSGWKMVGGFYEMLLLSAKYSRSLVWWENTLRKAIRRTI